MDSKTINKAYQTLVKRINASSRFFSGSGHDTFDSEGGCTTRFVWNQAQPAFVKIQTENGPIVALSLLFNSRAFFGVAICDGADDNNRITCVVSKHEVKKLGLNSFLSNLSKTVILSMRQCKSMFDVSNDEFKRVWLTTAMKANHNLYKLGHAGKPFLKASDSIESLAIAHDINS